MAAGADSRWVYDGLVRRLVRTAGRCPVAYYSWPCELKMEIYDGPSGLKVGVESSSVAARAD